MLRDVRFTMFAWGFDTFFLLGDEFSSGELGDVVFRVLFAWGRRFRHLFYLGICLGWIFLGL